nr:cytochrome P450 [Tanacetum cinerariifolium]
MELTAYCMENTLLSFFFFILTPFFLWFITNKLYNTKENLPPGPPQLPIIGNIHQFIGKKPHVSTAVFATKYGPLMSLRLGSQHLVVASSPEASMQILKRVLAILRTLCRVEIFSAKSIEAQSDLRNEKLAQLLDFLNITEGKVVKVEEVIFTTLFNTMSNILFSKDFLDLKGDHATANWMKMALQKALENAMVPNVKRRDRRASLNETNDVVVVEKKDFLDQLLDNNFTDLQINTLVSELFIAGTDTVVSTIEWAMAELLKNKEIMKKVQEELKSEINSNSSIMKFDFSKATYFNACIKETLRLHPVVPLLIPRRAVETCEVMGYTIPQNSQIWVNIWAISRDPKVWDEPNVFKPERFIASLILGFDWVLPHGEDPANLDMNEHFGVTLQKEKPLELIFKRKE